MAGYSGTPLQKKLGLKPGTRAAFIKEPTGYRKTLGALPAGLRVLARPGKDMDFVQLFCPSMKDLRARLSTAKRSLARDGTLWVSWPKKSSGMQSDLGEGDVRKAGLKLGLVDVKVCAVDETWSGLKFVYRIKDR
ncbi:MAG: DUF3052 domain-containing protein [Gammaproteobacteria bacterium]|nr:DUF3052 domain-containing protein [Gammaproteobacteria bacterium]